jgi:hypothetical protein
MKGVIFYGCYTVILLTIGSLIANQMGASVERSAPNQPTQLDCIK